MSQTLSEVLMSDKFSAKLIGLGTATQVASASAITLDMTTSHYEITGTTAINSTITGTGAVEGDIIVLRFASTSSITDDNNRLMNGAFTGAANECIVFINNGGGTTHWTELGRSIA